MHQGKTGRASKRILASQCHSATNAHIHVHVYMYSELSDGCCSPNTLNEPAKTINIRSESLNKHRSRKFMHLYIPDELLLHLLPFLDDTFTVGMQHKIYNIMSLMFLRPTIYM